MWSVECIVLTTNETAHRKNGVFRSYFLPKFCSVCDIKWIIIAIFVPVIPMGSY